MFIIVEHIRGDDSISEADTIRVRKTCANIGEVIEWRKACKYKIQHRVIGVQDGKAFEAILGLED